MQSLCNNMEGKNMQNDSQGGKKVKIGD